MFWAVVVGLSCIEVESLRFIVSGDSTATFALDPHESESGLAVFSVGMLESQRTLSRSSRNNPI